MQPSFTKTSKGIKSYILCIAILCLTSGIASAQNWNQILKAVASDRLTKSSVARAASDGYGYSVAIDGNYAIVGINMEDEDTEELNTISAAGSAVILYNNAGTWTQLKKLTPTNRLAGDNFGNSVAISGDYAIVGAYKEDEDATEGSTLSDAGSAYIFKKDQGGTDNWGQIKKICAGTRAASDNFGFSVAISGSYAIVGAYGEDEDASEANTQSASGSAYIFKADQGGTDNWGQIKKICAGTRAVSDNFGISVAISGSYAIVGAFLEDEDANEANTQSASGSAYIFKADQGGTDNWGQIKKICAGTRASGDNFGVSVAISGSYAIVGAYGEDEDANEANTQSASGSAYIFKQSQGGTDNWGQIKKITASTRAANDQFGISVAINGSYVIVGAYQEDEDANETNNLGGSGSAYIFKKDQGGTDNWGQIKKITASTRATNDLFGYAVAISGSNAIVGAYQEDENENDLTAVTDAGSAYLFKADQGGTDNWGIYQKTVYKGLVPTDNYGFAVAIDGNYAIIGAYNDDEDVNGLNPLLSAGSAYILKNTNGTWTQIKKLTASTRASADQFGTAVAISGDYAIVGANQEDQDASEANTVTDAGSVYIFKKDNGGTDNWGQIKKITASTRAATDLFGSSVAINGNYAIIGAYSEDEDSVEGSNISRSGSAYIFKADQGGTDNWGQVRKLTAGVRAVDDRFGWSVAISGNYAIVGAYSEDEDAAGANSLSSSGSAYIFKADHGGTDFWGRIRKITASTRAAGDNFGSSVSISGDYVIVGATDEDENASEGSTISASGSAYIFKQSQGGTDNWGQIKKITASTREASDNFGNAVAISGNYAIVGAWNEDEDASESNTLSASGSAYLFKADQGGTDNWGYIKKITAGTRSAGDNFGHVIAMSGDYALVGAYAEDEDASETNTLANSGSAYMWFNSCLPTNASLPSTASTTYTAAATNIDADGWTHYCSSNNELLLSLKIGNSGAVVPTSGVSLKLGNSTTYSSTGSGGMILHSNGYAMIDRRWNVSPASQPTSNVGVRYYFRDAEYTALQTALANLANPSTLSNVTQMNMYKATTGSAFADPHTVNGQVIYFSDQPRLNTCIYGTQGASDHYAEFLVSSFSGGGGGGGGGGGAGPGGLPLELLSFTATANGNDAQLHWQTANEIAVSHFTIERMNNNGLWEEIYTQAAINQRGTSSYQATDLNILSTRSGLPVYYRIITTNTDGSKELGPTVMLTSSTSSQLQTIYSEGQITINLQGNTEVMRCEMMDAGGRIVLTQTSNNSQLQLNTLQLAQGCYLVKIISATETKVAKVVVR